MEFGYKLRTVVRKISNVMVTDLGLERILKGGRGQVLLTLALSCNSVIICLSTRLLVKEK